MYIDKIEKIIEKIRSIAKHNPDIKELVSEQTANIRLKEQKDGAITLYCIDFSYYDALYVYSNHMVFCPHTGKKRNLFEYADWDGLLEL